MSDKDEKPAMTPDVPAAKPVESEHILRNDSTPGDTVATEEELDLARLAPQLRGLYEELLSEPIPDRFTKLLDDLERKETDPQ